MKEKALKWWFEELTIVERYMILDKTELYKYVREDSLTPTQIIGIFKKNELAEDKSNDLF